MRGRQVRTRVLALMDGSTVTGPLRQLASIVHPLREQEVELRVLVFRRRGARALPHVDFLSSQGIEPVILSDRGPFDPSPVGQFQRAVRSWGADIVQTHGYRPTAIAWLASRWGRSWRWAGWFHGTTSENAKVRLYHAIDRALLPSADRVVVVAEPQVARFPHAAGKLEVIHNASLDPVTSAGTDAGSDVPRHLLAGLVAPRLGFVGRLSPEKGLDVLLHAIALLRNRGIRVSLAVAGDGPERQSVERLGNSLGLEGSVLFLGQVRDVRNLYPELDVVVLPSRSEGLPNTLLEALRADRPVVATAVGAVPAVLAEPHSGVVVSPGDPEAVAQGILSALAAGTTPVAREARARTVSRFSIGARVQRHLALYDALLVR